MSVHRFTGLFIRLFVFLQVVPSVSYLYFKDMKERLRKEHCDVSIELQGFPCQEICVSEE